MVKKLIESLVRQWQRLIGYVPQFIYLTDDTLKRNIAFGLDDDDIDEGAIHAALESAQLRELVEELPEGIDYYAGESVALGYQADRDRE